MMPVSKTTDLLEQISTLEKSFNQFSFEELSAEEAKRLQLSFKDFRLGLENHIFTPTATNKTSSKETITAKAAQINAQKKVIAHVSHEMRTPLNGIIGFTNLLEDDNLSQQQLKKVKAIKTASNSLLKIVNELLEYTKVSSNKQTYQKIDFNLESTIKDIMFLSDTLIVDKNIKLNYTLDKEIPVTLTGDPSRLSQVLLNFLGNSIKFVEKGRIDLSVSLLHKNKENCNIEFKIKDTGIGIPESKLNSIFDSYTQAEEETYDKYGGTGLGLTISKQIIENQGGNIHLSSIVGVGTTITFSLPFSVAQKPEIAPKATTFNSNVGKELVKGTNILVFEDNQMNQHLIAQQVKKWDCNLYTNLSLENALDLMASKSIDIVFMDLKMPGMNGIETTKVLRKHENKRIREVPIIAFSADFSEEEKQACKALHIQGFLLKPYSIDELLSTIVKNKRSSDIKKNSFNLVKRKMIQKKETTTFNLNAVLTDCFNDLDMLKELIRLFKMNVTEFIRNVKTALDSQDLKTVALAAHKLKAGMAMLKAEGMRELVLEIELESKKSDLESVKELYGIFLQDYPHLEKNINEEVSRIDSSNS